MTIYTIRSEKSGDKIPLVDQETAKTAIENERRKRRTARRWVIGLSASLFFIFGALGLSLILYKNIPAFRSQRRTVICIVDYSFSFEFSPVSRSFEERVEIGENVQKIDMPSSIDFESAFIVHDFVRNLTAIVMKNRGQCFIKPMESVAHSGLNISRGYLRLNATALIQDYFVSLQKLENISELGKDVAFECARYPTYRLEKRPRQKRQAETKCVRIGTFCLGYVSGPNMECVNVKSCE